MLDLKKQTDLWLQQAHYANVQELESILPDGNEEETSKLFGWIDEISAEIERRKLKICEVGYKNCKFGAASLSHHDWHCPKCDHHLTSLYLCPECGTRYNPPNKQM